MDSKSSLQDFLEAHRGARLVLVSPGGNWGDYLIWAGAEALARAVGYTCHSLSFAEFMHAGAPSDAVLYLHGGGGYNPYASGRALEALLRAVTTHPGVVVQGPQTIDGSATYLEHLRQALQIRPTAREVTFFTREKSSLATLGEIRPDWMSVRIDHDTALHLDRDAYLALAGSDAPARYNLLGMREDNEAPAQLPATTTRKAVRLDPALYATSFVHWLRIHACAASIYTNRTHSAVAGAILGKPTTLSAGAYHKNRSIWEYSLRDRGVLWAEPAAKHDVTRPDGAREQRMLDRVRNSWKVRRVTHFLMGVPGK